jgi:hypothetical protein
MPVGIQVPIIIPRSIIRLCTRVVVTSDDEVYHYWAIEGGKQQAVSRGLLARKAEESGLVEAPLAKATHTIPRLQQGNVYLAAVVLF